MQKTILICLAAVLLAFSPTFAQKLDPEGPASGPPPIDINNLSQYDKESLISLLHVYENMTTEDAKIKAEKITAYLGTIDANWRVPKPPPAPDLAALTKSATRTVTALSRRAAPPTPASPSAAPAPAPSVVAAPSPAASPAPAASVAAPPTASLPAKNWYKDAERGMNNFWIVHGSGGTGGPPRGKIYDPATGQLVDLEEHTRQVGATQSFSDELANTEGGPKAYGQEFGITK